MTDVVKKNVVCVALGNYDSTGEAAMEFFNVQLTQAKYDNGDHYDAVREHVQERGKYQNRFASKNIVVFDEADRKSVGFDNEPGVGLEVIEI